MHSEINKKKKKSIDFGSSHSTYEFFWEEG
jgi:hypothetical protein